MIRHKSFATVISSFAKGCYLNFIWSLWGFWKLLMWKQNKTFTLSNKWVWVKIRYPKLWMVNTKLDLQHRNPSRMLNSGNIFFYDFNMVFDTIGRYEFDTLWIWGCDFDMVLIMFLIWFGLWFTYGIGCDWYGFNMVPMSWLQKKKQKQPRDRFLVDFSKDFCGFGMILIWFWYDFDTILIRFWYDFDTILVWFWSGFYMVPVSWLQKKKQKQPRDMFLVEFSMVFRVLVWFWYGFDTILIRFWYGFDMVPVSRLQKKKQKQPRDRFLVNLVEGFFCGFDMILTWFWCDFDTVLICFWYDFDMVLIRFCIWFWIWFRWVGFKSQVWPTSRIITETISKSYLKPYQHHNCKTKPETIHNNKSYLKRIKIIKKNILKNLHPRDFGCGKTRLTSVVP